MEVRFVNKAYNCSGLMIDGKKYTFSPKTELVVLLDDTEHDITVINGNRSSVHCNWFDLLTLRSVLLCGLVVSAECDYTFKLSAQESCTVAIENHQAAGTIKDYRYLSYRVTAENADISDEKYRICSYDRLKAGFRKRNLLVCSALPLIIVLLAVYFFFERANILLWIAAALFAVCTIPSMLRIKQYKDHLSPYEVSRALRSQKNTAPKRNRLLSFFDNRM